MVLIVVLIVSILTLPPERTTPDRALAGPVHAGARSGVVRSVPPLPAWRQCHRCTHLSLPPKISLNPGPFPANLRPRLGFRIPAGASWLLSPGFCRHNETNASLQRTAPRANRPDRHARRVGSLAARPGWSDLY